MAQDHRNSDALEGVLMAAAASLRQAPPSPLPPDFAATVVRVAARPAGGPLEWLGERVAGWFRPQQRQVRPAVQWAWVGALCTAAFLLAPIINEPTSESQTVLVRFAIAAPAAQSVALAGDFNGWDPAQIRLQRGADGHWAGAVSLPPGVYQYMFVVDGERWVADPSAAESLDDGFGQRNSLVRIQPANAEKAEDRGFL